MKLDVDDWHIENITAQVILYRIHDPKINSTLFIKLEEGEITFLVEANPK